MVTLLLSDYDFFSETGSNNKKIFYIPNILDYTFLILIIFYNVNITKHISRYVLNILLFFANV